MIRWTGLAIALCACTSPAPLVPTRDAATTDGTRRPPRVGVGGGGGGTIGDGECGARVLVIFDRSGSMDAPWGIDGQPRWDVAQAALDAAIAPLAGSLEVGAILFPSSPDGSPDDTCEPVDSIREQLDFRAGSSFLSAWRSLWSSAEVFGWTPIDSAFDAAAEALPDDDVVTAVILLTDGEPTCSGPTPARDRVAEWAARGVRTFVIGLPGASGSSYLHAIASAGDTGGVLSPEDAGTLSGDLASILGGAVEQACGE